MGLPVCFPARQSPSEKGFNAFQRHAYSNILKISPPTNERFQIIFFFFFFFFFHISAQNIDCGNSF